MLTVVIAGCVVVLACWCMLAWVSRQMRSEFQRQFGTLAAAVRTLEQGAAGRAVAPVPVDVPKIEIVAARSTESLAVLPAAVQESRAIPPETQAVITTTLSALLGHKVRIRSVKLLEAGAATTWSTQGRVAIQASHHPHVTRD
jgi:hypothetical protein